MIRSTLPAFYQLVNKANDRMYEGSGYAILDMDDVVWSVLIEHNSKTNRTSYTFDRNGVRVTAKFAKETLT